MLVRISLVDRYFGAVCGMSEIRKSIDGAAVRIGLGLYELNTNLILPSGLHQQHLTGYKGD